MIGSWTGRVVAVSAAFAAAVLVGASPSFAAVPVESAGAAVRVHTVVDRDTSWGLAARFCGRGDLHATRVAVYSRQGVRRNPAWIYVGDTARISCTGTGTASPVRVAARPAPAGWVAPLAGALRCSSKWGDPRDGGRRSHKGIDLPRRAGTPIRAVHAGRVLRVSWSSLGGWSVTLTHPDGTRSAYRHMRTRSFLRTGAYVAAGATVGYVGSTGHSSGAHLHFEIQRGAGAINPTPFLRARGVALLGGC